MSNAPRLILARHAHAETAVAGQIDADRPLSARGIAEAQAAARWLIDHVRKPCEVRVSPARRACETWQQLRWSDAPEAREEPSIYEATPGDLLALIGEHVEGDLMLVGHNPGLETLVALLVSGRSGDFRGMPPGGIAVLSAPDSSWEPGSASLLEFWSP